MIMAMEMVKSQTVGKVTSRARFEIVRLSRSFSNHIILEKRHEHLETKTYRLIIFDGEAEIGTSVWHLSREHAAPTQ